MFAHYMSMHVLLRSIFAITFLGATLTGCYSSPDVASAEQEEFILKLRRLSSEIDQLNSIEPQAHSAGKLPPSDLADRIRNKEAEIDEALHVTTPAALSWNARLDKLRRDGSLVVINASYKEQLYEFKIFDDKAKIIAENLTRGDKVIFSGSLGPERSLTRQGAFLNPEFSFYPTSIRTEGIELTQPQDQIEKLLADARRAEEDIGQRGQIKDLCKQTVIGMVKYPASAHFAWFKDSWKKMSDNNWKYSGVVESSTDTGGTLAVRFVCSAIVKSDAIEASVRFLD